MAKAKTKEPRPWLVRWVRRVRRALILLALLPLAYMLLLRFVPPPTTPYALAKGIRLGGIERTWVPMDEIAPVLARSVVAAEDANFCEHWGFDVGAIRAAIEAGGSRGASTISQQTVKNVLLWQGRSWPRKALEAALTPAAELIWPKRRILELYLNVAEMGPGVFGAEAAARHWFGVSAAELTAEQAADIAAILPSPQTRSAARPGAATRKRAASIADGAALIARDGRAACFEAP